MSFFLLVLSILLSVPLLVVAGQAFVTLFRRTNAADGSMDLTAKIPLSAYKILIPAHNEAGIIKKTLDGLIAALPENAPGQILVIADNCSDDTAKIARASGVVVIERRDAKQRGKGFALDFGIQHLKANNPPEVVVIMDADCETDRNSLIKLILSVVNSKKPAQMIYLMRNAENAGIKQKISAFAWLLKNQVRLLGMHRLVLPVSLTGTGMAFPWAALETVNLHHGNIVEDMQLGIDCAINGFPPALCPGAMVYSTFPAQASAELSQRTRWEHGHLQTIVRQVPRLIKEAVKQKNLGLLALALDIGVPPLSLTVMLALAALAVLAVCALLTGKSAPFFLLLLSFCGFTAMLGLVWWRFGQGILSVKELMGIPNYVISKLTIYQRFLHKRQEEWVRTDRDSQ